MSNDSETLASDEALIADPELRQPDGSLLAQAFFGITRHELIGGAAQGFLGPGAQEAVSRILEPLGQTSLRQIAAWADGVTNWDQEPPSDDPETLAFFADGENAQNGTWHYVNLPLGAEAYDRERYPTFTRPDDVVQMILASVRVLQGDSDRFSEANALRLVTHFVGDLHQPIHVGCGYLEESNGSATLVWDPIAALGLDHDAGGNRIFLPINGGWKMHSYWDRELGDDGLVVGAAEAANSMAGTPGSDRRDRCIQKLQALIRRSQPTDHLAAEAAATASPEAWVVQWAGESLLGARSAYETLAITGRRQDGRGYNVSWEGRQAYDARCGPIIVEQMTKAGQNLAALLNAIWP